MLDLTGYHGCFFVFFVAGLPKELMALALLAEGPLWHLPLPAGCPCRHAPPPGPTVRTPLVIPDYTGLRCGLDWTYPPVAWTTFLPVERIALHRSIPEY